MINKILQQPFHGLGVLIELDHVIDQGAGLADRNRLVVGKERAGAGDVRFSLPVRAAVKKLCCGGRARFDGTMAL